jgi:hypothetical protein
MTLIQQFLAEVTPEEAGSPGDQYSLHLHLLPRKTSQITYEPLTAYPIRPHGPHSNAADIGIYATGIYISSAYLD